MRHPMSRARPNTPKTVAVASRATRDVEKRYPQLDLKALAVDYGLQEMRIYLAGNPDVTVATDHKPLLPIFRGTRPGLVQSDRIIFSELTILAGGNVIRGERPILPCELQSKAIRMAHGVSQLGASSAKRRLCTVLWFPRLDRAMDKFVSQCVTCQLVTEKHTKVQQRHHPTPALPWESVSIDLFGPLPDQSHILVAQCHLSHYPSPTFVRTTSAKETILAVTEICSTFGFPRTQRSDNGPAFKSDQFRQFCDKTELPVVKGIKSQEMEAVCCGDRTHRRDGVEKFNARWRTHPSTVQPGQWVLLRDHLRPSKLHTTLEPTPHQALNKQGHATFLLRNQTDQDVCIRHEDDMKVIPGPTRNIFVRPKTAKIPVPLWIDQPRREAPSRITISPSPANSPPIPGRPSHSSVSSSSSHLGHLRPDPESQLLLN
ncbi:uncharacterized protein LOC131884886 [Tigriopus californicus]|uniref:uncharacterized protein LOC131884886 n=1 Tax=Tigriopus californicus TaxID=6832 RepID=UPI0027DA0BD1|nr:uncharacterized protein LOC131884886 [Tigriopus californicus]